MVSIPTDLVEVLAIFLLLTILLKYMLSPGKHQNYPPGPRGLPLLGNVLQFGKDPCLQMAKWKNKYGSIYSLKLGLDRAIVISDPNLLKEVYSDKAASGRPQNPILSAFTQGDYGVLMTEAKQWEELRSFVIRTLRELGYSKSSMDGMIGAEAVSLVERLKQFMGKPFSTEGEFNTSVVNSLWFIMSGELSTAEVVKKSMALVNSVKQATDTGLLFAPILKYVAPEWSGYNGYISCIKDAYEFTDKAVARHRSKLDVSNPRDLMDHLLVEIQRTNNPNSSFYGETGEKNLSATIMELFEGGSETTSGTLSWCFLYLAHHQDIQEKLRNEIHSVVGKDRTISLSDKPNMPYTQAVMQETLRISSVLPMGVFRRMLEGREFHGYDFPKDTMILPDLYGIHRDPEIWSDPNDFRPERFLSDDGTSVVQHDALLSFSYGNRKCVGESFARDSLFIFIGTIFQRLRVLPDPENLKPDYGCSFCFLNLPKPFRIVIELI